MALRRELTAKEQREMLGVPSLEGNNVFTGTNEFQGALTAADGSLYLGSNANVLDGSAGSGPWAWSLPGASGTLALSGAALVLPYTAKSATYAITANVSLIEATSGTWTATLPTAAGRAGQHFTLKNSGVGTITVDTTGGETIDGAATATVAASAVLRVASNGSNWIIV